MSSAARDERIEVRSELIDVTTLDLDRVEALPDSVLGWALRRVIHEAGSQPERYSQFQNGPVADE